MFPQDLIGRMIRNLGSKGTMVKNAQGTVTGDWIKITCVAAAVIVVKVDWTNAGATESITLAANQSVYGGFTQIAVTSGTVVAY